jgi:hypothetical protein
MFDASRWVLVEAWLSLGLRMRWAIGYEGGNDREWFTDDETQLRYSYVGYGEWVVLRPGDRYRSVGFPPNDSPQLGSESMRHELAHYLVSTEEQREKKNFGLAQDDYNAERHALLADQVIDAMTRACSRIVSTTIKGSSRP